MDTASLQEFMTSVPACLEADHLMDVWELFQQAECEQVVVTNEQSVPLGLLPLKRLAPFLLSVDSSQEPPSATAQSTAAQNTAGALNRSRSVGQLRQACILEGRALLEPLIPLPLFWNLDQLQPYLKDIAHYQWALVDSSGQYAGLLNRLQLLQFLMLHQPAPGAAGASGSPALLDPLVDLLERIPIPLMLQTTTGRVITQNLSWRQQVGELQDPSKIRREAASILETMGEEAFGDPIHAPDVAASAALTDLKLTDFYSGSWENPVNQPSGSVRQAGSCRLGTEPNTCICVCPMRSGPDRVWQFIKIPMGTIAAEQPTHAALESTTRFKLATLGFSPDPNWRSLAQTESLCLVLAQDMTEQQLVAKELAAKNADLVQLNRLKDEFLACISHELKTPLTAVLGLSSLLKDHQLGELNERQSRYAQLIYQSGRHLILIVNDILDLTRIETRQLELTPEPVHIEAVCLRAYDQAKQLLLSEAGAGVSAEELAEKAQLRFTLEIQPELDQLMADELRLRQMLANLLSNAFKFTEVGGEIGLRVETWEGWIAFTVWDTGIGIPADKQHLIFQKFQQLENPMTRRFEGTGLGLVLTQRLARLHGGEVTFTSAEGAGSQFTLLLPPGLPRTHTAGSRAPTRTAENRLVLVVESMPHLLDRLSNLLMRLGYRVAIARSGTEALEKTRRLQPGAVLLNPLLPLLSGWDVLTLLKADEETQHIPVIVTGTRVEKSQAYQNGADGFLYLPIDRAALQACLDRLIHPEAAGISAPPTSLTVLHLRGDMPQTSLTAHALNHDLNEVLHPYQCRVLEVDDPEQADLLSRVWKPDVVLVDGTFADPVSFMRQLSQYPFLAALPLVTLTPALTQAANQIPGLMVFPCLAPVNTAENGEVEIAALLQVMQIAAGMSWTPHILIADLVTLAADMLNIPVTQHVSTDRLQALTQYLKTAGFRSSVSQQWEEVQQQLRLQSTDLLLLYLPEGATAPQLTAIAQRLNQLEIKQPILIWGGQSTAALASETLLWQSFAAQVLPPALSMPELLSCIQQALEMQL